MNGGLESMKEAKVLQMQTDRVFLAALLFLVRDSGTPVSLPTSISPVDKMRPS